MIFYHFQNFQVKKIIDVRFLALNGFLMIKINKNYHILFMEIDFCIIWLDI